MNRKFFIYALLYGLVFGWLAFRGLSPEKRRFFLNLPEKENSERVIEEEGNKLKVTDLGDRMLLVEYEPEVSWGFYLLAGAIGLLFGKGYYDSLL